MKPFFTYYGGKWRAAPKYPHPKFNTIVEPFAGAAGYALRYAEHKIILIDQNPIIANLWKYLIRVSPTEIRSLPIAVDHVDDLKVCQEARWLIGFWLNKGSTGPKKTPSKWMRDGLRPKSYWGEEIRERVASQVSDIRHWEVIEGSYETAPDLIATWFIDPPYAQAGKLYPHGSRGINYKALGKWCETRSGQTIVCEGEGATWLPFRPFGFTKATEGARGKKISKEVIWTHESDDPPWL